MALQSQLFKGDPRLEAAAVSDPAHIVPGSAGPHVGKIQLALITLSGAAIALDSVYGPATAAAVLSFKQKRNIVNRSYQTKADNIVGKMTIAVLDKEMLAEEGKPIVVIVQSLIEVLRLFFLTLPSIIRIIGNARFQYEQQAQNLESALGVSEVKPGRVQLDFGIVVPRRRFPFPIPPFLQTLFNTFQSNPAQDPATAAFEATVAFLVLLALAIAALRTQVSDTRTRTIIGELEKLERITVEQSVDQARKTKQEVKANDAKMQECRDQKPNLLGPGGRCAELAKIYDQIRDELFRKLTQYIASPLRFPNLRQAINKLLDDIAQAFADLKDCLGCNF